MSDENRSVSGSSRVTSSGCWFGTNGQYYHQKSDKRRLPGRPDEEGTWVFGLEDRYFPLKRPAPLPPTEQVCKLADTGQSDVDGEEMDKKKEDDGEDGDDDQSDCISNSTVDGLTDEMMKFLELRLAQVAIKDTEASGHDETSDESTAPPVPPRRKRLQRSQSTTTIPLSPTVSNTPLVEHRILSSVQTSSASSSSSLSSSSRLGRRGSLAGDVIQRVKRWAAVTTNIRRAFRRVEQISSSSSSTKPRFFLPPPVVFPFP